MHACAIWRHDGIPGHKRGLLLAPGCVRWYSTHLQCPPPPHTIYLGASLTTQSQIACGQAQTLQVMLHTALLT